jgi:hypothetical protein
MQLKATLNSRSLQTIKQLGTTEPNRFTSQSLHATKQRILTKATFSFIFFVHVETAAAAANELVV